MIMDGLETMSFAEANVHFHHLLNFEIPFKAEMPDDSVNLIGRRTETNNINDSLNTPGISSFTDLSIFFPSNPVLSTLPSVFSGKKLVLDTKSTRRVYYY
jgi:hypothetical protein